MCVAIYLPAQLRKKTFISKHLKRFRIATTERSQNQQTALKLYFKRRKKRTFFLFIEFKHYFINIENKMQNFL